MYESFYGLSGKPFQLSPDPSFYFASRGHQKAFSYLEYGVVQGEGFIVITGDIGAGKTTLVRSLIQRLDPAKVVAAQLVSTHLGGDDMLRAVAATFGVNVRHDDKARLIAEIEAFLMALVVARKRPLLLVDEAQNLSLEALEELRMLSNFQMGALQSFLIGQPELRELMRSDETEQFRQRIIASYHLGPLNAPEVRSYIEHRLKRVGWTGKPSFADDVFEAIYGTTGGIPRKINKLCERLMLSGFLAEKVSITATEVAEVVRELNDEDLPPAEGRKAAPARTSDPGDRVSLVPPPQRTIPADPQKSTSAESGNAATAIERNGSLEQCIDELDHCIQRLQRSIAELESAFSSQPSGRPIETAAIAGVGP